MPLTEKYNNSNGKLKLKLAKMKILKEHRQFRNQLIIITFICFCVGWFIAEMIAFGIIFGLLSVWNTLTYRENVKDYNKLKSDV